MVVDDHPIWREGVARDLAERGLEVVATAPDADAAVRIATAVRPQVVLMDLNLGETSGVQAIEGILDALPDTRILVLSASGEHADVLDAVKAGASRLPGEVGGRGGAARRPCSAPRTASRCSPPAWPGWCSASTGGSRAGRPSPAVPALTERETDVLRLVAKGLTARADRRAARRCRTARWRRHVQNTLRKLQLHNRVQLVRYAIEQGL